MNTISKVWPEWKVEKEIGRGSHGTVYKCFKEENGGKEYSAVKVISVPQSEYEMSDVISEKMTNDQSKAYYKDIAYDLFKEIEILKALKGTKNIVEIYDAEIVEKDDGIGWYILIRMELLTDFNTYSSDKKFTEAEVIKLGIDLCNALSVCHKARIIHRDVKPENIFVDAEGNYKLGDFGVAKQLEKTQGSMSVKGTYDYMSPEVFGGKKGDGRADLYSLAVVMYKLLNNNRLPFLDPDKQLIRYSERQNAFEKRIKGVELPVIKNVSKELNAIILKACSFKNTDRQKNVDVFRKQLEKIAKEKCAISKVMLKAIIVTALVAVCGSLVAAIIYGTSENFKNSVNDTEVSEDTQQDEIELKREYNQIATMAYDIYEYNNVDQKYLISSYAEDGYNTIPYLVDLKDESYINICEDIGLNYKKSYICLCDRTSYYYVEDKENFNAFGEKIGYSIYRYDRKTKESIEILSSEKNSLRGLFYADDRFLYYAENDDTSEEMFGLLPDNLKRYDLLNKKIVTIAHDIYTPIFYNGYLIFSADVNGCYTLAPLWVYDIVTQKLRLISEEALTVEKLYFDGNVVYFRETYATENDDMSDYNGTNIQISKYDLIDDKKEIVSDLNKSGLSFDAETGAVYCFNDKYAVLHDTGGEDAYIWSYKENTCRKIDINQSEFSNWGYYNCFVNDKSVSENILYIETEGYSFKLYELLPNGELKQLGNELFVKEADIRTFGSKLMYFGQGGKIIEIKDFFKDGLSETVEYTECNEMVYANSRGPGTNIRIAPILEEYTFVDYLEEGESIKRVATGSNGWSKVIYNDKLVYAKTYNLDLLTATDEDISLFTNMMANIIYKGIDEYYNDETEYYAVATSELNDDLPIVNVDNYELNGCVYTFEVSARFQNSDEIIARYCVSAVLKSSEDGHFWEIESINVNPSYDAKLYREFLETNYESSDKQYSVYDMNNDGKKEVIIYGKTKKNQTKCEVFSVINAKVISIGEFIFKGEYLYESTLNTLSYSEYYSESNAVEEGQEIEVILVSVNDNTISETKHTYKAEELILNRLIKLPVDNNGLLSY